MKTKDEREKKRAKKQGNHHKTKKNSGKAHRDESKNTKKAFLFFFPEPLHEMLLDKIVTH